MGCLAENFSDVACAVAETDCRASDLVCNGQEQIGQRDVIAVAEMGTMLESHVLASAEDDWIVGRLVGLAGRTAIKTKCVVQQSAVTFMN